MGGGCLDTSGPLTQFKVLERSLGPRPLLSGIEIWGIMGLAILSVCPKLLVLVSVLLSPEKPETTVSALTTTPPEPPTHLGRA